MDWVKRVWRAGNEHVSWISAPEEPGLVYICIIRKAQWQALHMDQFL